MLIIGTIQAVCLNTVGRKAEAGRRRDDQRIRTAGDSRNQGIPQAFVEKSNRDDILSSLNSTKTLSLAQSAGTARRSG